jgi:isoquinoline 1-oxidoreductase alpha subunit
MKIQVNGTWHNFDGDATTPLLWFLRDEINLTGTKYSCGAGLCGACTVHLDGRAMRSCIVTMAATEGKSVTTIEGLSDSASHPLQKAWAEQQVPQCGFCQPGQIMQAASLLAENPSPEDAEIDSAMQGNICRCGTYVRIRAAIKSVAQQP